jgi:hypothetical protein
VIAAVEHALSPDFPHGDSLAVFVRREDAERFIEQVRSDEPELASYLRIEERDLEREAMVRSRERQARTRV